MTGLPDYRRDGFAEIVFGQKEAIAERDATIAEQGGRLLELGVLNLALREDAELATREENQRYAEVLILVENWVHARVSEGGRTVDAPALLEVLRDVFEYAEEGKEPAWYGAAVRAMGGE